MMQLTELRERIEKVRFERQHRDDDAQPLSDADRNSFVAELRSHVRGEIRFDDGSRALYATDGSNYRQVPIGVVVPQNIDDIVWTVTTARK
jgi:hypothetical protein